MSSSPLPVPSKVALTALHGLVLGTSCTVALIVEDRRRRINQALKTIENGERIRSARNYSAAGAAFALALEEEAVHLDAEAIAWSRERPAVTTRLLRENMECDASRISRPRTRNALTEPPSSAFVVGEAVSVAAGPNDGAGRVERAVDVQSTIAPSITTLVKPNPFTPPLSRLRSSAAGVLPTDFHANASWLLPRWERQVALEVDRAAYAFPSVEEIVSHVHDACEQKDIRRLDGVAQLVLSAYGYRTPPDNSDRPWMEASARLCRTLRERGRVEVAHTIVQMVVARGPLEESDYWLHEPSLLIQSLLLESQELLARSPDNAVAARKKFDFAVSIYLPTFAEKPGNNLDAYDLGRRLLDWAFSTGALSRIEELYWRCFCYASEGSRNDLTEYFITNLCKVQQNRKAIKFFVLNYKSFPTVEALALVGDAVVQAVENAHNYKARQVLETLMKLWAGKQTFKTSWFIRLLKADWNRHRNFERSESLFRDLLRPNLEQVVVYADGVYRIMIEIALEAREQRKAVSYFDELVARYPDLASDARLRGLFALSSAKCGDWAGVRAEFARMKQENGTWARPDAVSDVFVPVLKVYARAHSGSETEDFLRLYIDELKVPICRYMVTLVASVYGQMRNAEAFVAWLRYCATAGFQIDGAFANAILVNCEKRWRFSFGSLRNVFRLLKSLSPDFVDGFTERYMKYAALRIPANPGRARARVLSLHVGTKPLPPQGEWSNVSEVYLGMKQALQSGSVHRATRIYERALQLRMPLSSDTLLLAVRSALKAKPPDPKKAYVFIRDARARGQDVEDAASFLAASQLRAINARRRGISGIQVVEAIQSVIAQFEVAGFRLGAKVYQRAARTLLGGFHFVEAVQYALRAAELTGRRGPCYDLENFRILAGAYAALLDVEGLRAAIGAAQSSSYKGDTAYQKALAQTRHRLRKFGRPVDPERAKAAEAVLADAMTEASGARRALGQEQRYLQAETLSIMRQAALDAVDYHHAADDWDEMGPERLKVEGREIIIDEGISIDEEIPF